MFIHLFIYLFLVAVVVGSCLGSGCLATGAELRLAVPQSGLPALALGHITLRQQGGWGAKQRQR